MHVSLQSHDVDAHRTGPGMIWQSLANEGADLKLPEEP